MVTRTWQQFGYRIKACYGSPLWVAFNVGMACCNAYKCAVDLPGRSMAAFTLGFFIELAGLTLVGGLVGGLRLDAIDRGEWVASGPRGRLD